FDESRQIVIGGHVREDVPGVEVVTPLVLRDGSAVLIDRGWIPVAEAGPVSLAPYAEPGAQRVVGYPESLAAGLRPPPLAVRATSRGIVCLGRGPAPGNIAAPVAVPLRVPPPPPGAPP